MIGDNIDHLPHARETSHGVCVISILSDAGRHNANDADEMISANKRESYGRKMYGKNQ